MRPTESDMPEPAEGAEPRPSGRTQGPDSSVARAAVETTAVGIVIQLALVISGVIAARLLGVENRGHLALLWLLPLTLAALGNLGLPLASTYYLARDPGTARAIVHRAIRSALLQTAAVTAAQGVALYFLLQGEGRTIELAGAVSLAWPAALMTLIYGLAVLQGLQRFREFNALRILPALLNAGGLAVAAVLGVDSLLTITAISVASWLLPGLAALVAVSRALPSEESAGDVPSERKMLGFGLRGLLGSVSPVELLSLDQIIVGVFLSPFALGLYTSAAALTNLPRLIGQSAGIVAYPHIARVDERARAGRALWRFLGITLLASTAVMLVLEASAGWLIEFAFGEDFAGATPIARILLIGAVFMSGKRVLSDALRGAGHPTLGTIAELASWVALAIGLGILVPLEGATGAAWAVSASFMVNFALLVILALASTELQAPSATPEQPDSVPAAP